MANENITEEQHTHDIYIALAKDYYTAYISIEINPKAGSLTREQVERAIAKKNVVYGIDKQVIDDLLNKQEDVVDLLFATGRRHVNARDGEIKYRFNTEDLGQPHVNQDGSVDFKNVNRFIVVEKGKKLATRTLPTDPQDGLTVTGKTIRPRPGKEVRFKFGKNVKRSEDGLALIAEEKGGIEFKNGIISVVNVLTINSDVGVKTGNVVFRGKVVINGSITTGYSVEADEDIVVNGVVEAAQVKTNGNLMVTGGILGHQEAKIEVGGDIAAKFLYSSDVVCRGDIMVDSIMHCNINCQGRIVVAGKKSLVVGGKITSWYGLQAGIIGSEMGTQTSLQLGLNSEILNRLQAADDNITELNEAIDKIDKVIRLLQIQSEQTDEPKVNKMLNDALVSKQDYEDKLKATETEKEDIKRLIKKLDQVKLTASTAYQGVLIKVSNSFHRVVEVQKQLEIVLRDGQLEATYI